VNSGGQNEKPTGKSGETKKKPARQKWNIQINAERGGNRTENVASRISREKKQQRKKKENRLYRDTMPLKPQHNLRGKNIDIVRNLKCPRGRRRAQGEEEEWGIVWGGRPDKTNKSKNGVNV